MHQIIHEAFVFLAATLKQGPMQRPHSEHVRAQRWTARVMPCLSCSALPKLHPDCIRTNYCNRRGQQAASQLSSANKCASRHSQKPSAFWQHVWQRANKQTARRPGKSRRGRTQQQACMEATQGIGSMPCLSCSALPKLHPDYIRTNYCNRRGQQAACQLSSANKCASRHLQKSSAFWQHVWQRANKQTDARCPGKSRRGRTQLQACIEATQGIGSMPCLSCSALPKLHPDYIRTSYCNRRGQQAACQLSSANKCARRHSRKPSAFWQHVWQRANKQTARRPGKSRRGRTQQQACIEATQGIGSMPCLSCSALPTLHPDYIRTSYCNRRGQQAACQLSSANKCASRHLQKPSAFWQHVWQRANKQTARRPGKSRRGRTQQQACIEATQGIGSMPCLSCSALPKLHSDYIRTNYCNRRGQQAACQLSSANKCASRHLQKSSAFWQHVWQRANKQTDARCPGKSRRGRTQQQACIEATQGIGSMPCRSSSALPKLHPDYIRTSYCNRRGQQAACQLSSANKCASRHWRKPSAFWQHVWQRANKQTARRPGKSRRGRTQQQACIEATQGIGSMPCLSCSALPKLHPDYIRTNYCNRRGQQAACQLSSMDKCTSRHWRKPSSFRHFANKLMQDAQGKAHEAARTSKPTSMASYQIATQGFSLRHTTFVELGIWHS